VTISVQGYKRQFYQIANRIEKSIRQRESNRIELFFPESECSSVKCLCKCRIYRWMFQICSALNHVRACILRNNMTDIVCLKLLHTKVEQADQTFILALIVSPYYVYVGWSVCGIT